MIPFVDLSWQNRQVAARVLQRVAAVASSNQFVGGEAVAAFEAQFARYCGAARCVAVNSGTEAVPYLYTVRAPDRDRLRAFLIQSGVKR